MIHSSRLHCITIHKQVNYIAFHHGELSAVLRTPAYGLALKITKTLTALDV